MRKVLIALMVLVLGTTSVSVVAQTTPIPEENIQTPSRLWLGVMAKKDEGLGITASYNRLRIAGITKLSEQDFSDGFSRKIFSISGELIYFPHDWEMIDHPITLGKEWIPIFRLSAKSGVGGGIRYSNIERESRYGNLSATSKFGVFISGVAELSLKSENIEVFTGIQIIPRLNEAGPTVDVPTYWGVNITSSLLSELLGLLNTSN